VNGTAIRAACSPHPNPLPRGERGSTVRILFLTLFSEGRGDRQCGNCLWRSLNPQHSCYPRLRHSVHSFLVIPASGILRTLFSLSMPQAFCALLSRYPRLRHSAHALLVIPASGVLPTPFSLSPPQAFCALPHKSAHNPASPSLRPCVCGHHTPMTLQPWDKPCVMKS